MNRDDFNTESGSQVFEKPNQEGKFIDYYHGASSVGTSRWKASGYSLL